MKLLPTYQKLRGGYYTPEPIAHFLAEWAIQSSAATVLEPSCGDGVLLEAALQVLVDHGATPQTASSLLHAVEIDPDEAVRARERLSNLISNPSAAEIVIGDFFAYCREHLSDRQSFDAVIGNPPFIRYQNFPEEHRATAFELMRDAGLRPNRLTNVWVPFLVATTLLLRKNGRMAMVVPAELLQVNYAAELRSFLSSNYSALTLITFKKLVFEGIQQEVVLLLGERNGNNHTGIRTIEFEGISDLVSYEQPILARDDLKEMDHSTEKWTMYFLDHKELALIRKLRTHPGLTPAGDVISVDVGIVTGNNDFFVLTKKEVDDNALQDYVIPLVGRSAHLQGSIFTRSDWSLLVERHQPAFLMQIPEIPFTDLPDSLQSYITSGEFKGIHTGFKCRNRKLWYVVPSIWTPDAFMLRQVHGYPKIILNDADATCTDTIHRVRMRSGAPGRTTVAAAFLNSLTFAFSEIIGRSYGGGVLELEPNEAERLPLPLSGADTINFYDVDDLLREGNIGKALDASDRILLKKELGLTAREIGLLRGMWEKLRDRRINRKPERLNGTRKDSAEIVSEARKNHKLRQDWAGGLADLRDQYTSLELQKKALEWRNDD